MTPALAALLGGLVLGAAAALALRRLVVGHRARRLWRAWSAGPGTGRAVAHRLSGERPGVKRRIGGELAPRLADLPFEPADVRFLGDPSHFVVFAGYTGVRERVVEELGEVVFLTVVQGEDGSEREAELVGECARAGRVRWLTLRPEGGP